jgi:acetoin utilization deacetylase AcuC-like enzyme
LSNLATERKLADLERQLQSREMTMLGMMFIIPIVLVMLIGFGVNATKDNMLQEIQQMNSQIPESIDRYHQEQAELLKEEKKQKQKRKKRKP